MTAVLAQLEGKADGLAGLILRRDLLEWILRRLIGDGDVKTLSERALSALCEVGNIAVSAAANALNNQMITEQTATAAGQAASQGARPLSQNAYKVRLIEVAVKRAILIAAGQRRYWEV